MICILSQIPLNHFVWRKIALDKLCNLFTLLNMSNDDMEKCCCVSTDFIRKLTYFFLIFIGEKASTKIPMRKMYCLKKCATLTCLYGLMCLQLDDYDPYSDKISNIFDTHINSNLRCIHGYTNRVTHTDSITWVSNSSWDMLLSEFIHDIRISACPSTTIFQ